MRDDKEWVSMQIVRDIALGISQTQNIGDLYASDGWLSIFIEWNKFSFRRVTNFVALSDENSATDTAPTLMTTK